MSTYRAYWDCEPEQAPERTGAAGLMDCRDIREVLEHLHVDLSGNVLDVGCGTGRCAQLVTGVWSGVDISPGMVQHAYKSGLPATLIDGPDDLDVWGQGDFDAILCLSVFTHIGREDRRAYLRQFIRLLRPKGKLLVDILPDPDGYGSPAAWSANPDAFKIDVISTGFVLSGTYDRTAHTGYLHRYFRAVRP